MNVRKLTCQEICEVLRLPTMARILHELIKAYKNRLPISKLQETTSEPRMMMLFHSNRFRESNLVELDGPRRSKGGDKGFGKVVR
jgi:hypothetical protein